MPWDLFCHVIDNHGDTGVCWRLAADLAARGVQVRLWIDERSALSWMAPDGAQGVSVLPWPAAPAAIDPGEVVIEAFGCQLPEWFVHRMVRSQRAPLWINLEYLSAEGFVERSHKLLSPQLGGPGVGLSKRFFYPGYTTRTGGLIREPDLLARQQEFDAPAWLALHGAQARGDEQVVSLFCYEQRALRALLDQLVRHPTLLLATAGHAARQVRALLGPTLRHGSLRALLLPELTQRDYDHLLWASDLNFVRGEDTPVRAQWAGKPFVWQAYPQHDGAHINKVDALLARLLADADAALATALTDFVHAWNASATRLPELSFASPQWRDQCMTWREQLLAQADLTSQLLDLVAEPR